MQGSGGVYALKNFNALLFGKVSNRDILDFLSSDLSRCRNCNLICLFQ